MDIYLKEKLATLTQSPGCYLMKNDNHEIIYVGKAKNLHKRVNSYFNRPQSGKTQKMVGEIRDFDFIITNSEKEALILELNLVQHHDPRYNVLLKDDKTYPYIQIKNMRHPAIKIARNTKDKTSKYYGPYPDSQAAYQIVNLLNQIFPLRKCKTLPKKPCLYYHLGQCIAPCINMIPPEQYQSIIEDINRFMHGNTSTIRDDLVKKMQQLSLEMKYEQANEVKKLITSIDYMQKGQSVQLNDRVDCDIFAYHARNDYISIATLIVRDGKLLTKMNAILPLYTDEEEVVTSYLMQFYAKNIKPSLIVMPKTADIDALSEALNVRIINPSRGKHYDLLTIAAQNAIKAMEDNSLKLSVIGNDTNDVMDLLAKKLGINYPKQIEFIDNSHTNGGEAVSAVVVFVNGNPMRKMYRKYRINNQFKGADDKAMYEVLYRRFYRMLSEKKSFSDVLFVDGGIIQVRAAQKALADLQITLPVFGVVKDQNHRTNGIISVDNEFISIKEDKPLFFFVTKMQDEVHRYVIDFHRKARNKSLISSILDSIDGLGPVRKEKLLHIYGTVQKIAEASVEELAQYLPKNVAINVKNYLEKADSF